MAAGDRWVESAMAEDSLVAELLMRLRSASPSPSSTPPPPGFHLEWTVRQRRSKSNAVNEKRKRVSPLLGSPTTPLSWSGATSASAGSVSGAGSEDSGRSAAQDTSGATRSKISSDSERTNSKRPRKKKTLAELKDEESSLLKERKVLKTEMAALRLNLERQRVRNENIKRAKIEFQPCLDTSSISAREESFNQDQQRLSDGRPPTMMTNNILEQQTSSEFREETKAVSGPKFALPDLNIPFEDPTLDVVWRVS